MTYKKNIDKITIHRNREKNSENVFLHFVDLYQLLYIRAKGSIELQFSQNVFYTSSSKLVLLTFQEKLKSSSVRFLKCHSVLKNTFYNHCKYIRKILGAIKSISFHKKKFDFTVLYQISQYMKRNTYCVSLPLIFLTKLTRARAISKWGNR